MANAQVLVLVRSSAPLTPAQVQNAVQSAGVALGFVPGPWTWNTQSVGIVQDPANLPPPSRIDNAVSAAVANGPWAGFTFAVDASVADPGVTRTGRTESFNAYRQNFLNGPTVDGLTAAIRTALLPVAGAPARVLVSAMTNPAHRVPWDKGIPPAIDFTLTSPTPASNGLFWGILAIAGVAFVASRGSAAKSMSMGKLSTNREGLTFEQWRRAAAVPPSTPGVHAWARGEDPSDWRAMRHAVTVASRTRLQGLRRW